VRYDSCAAAVAVDNRRYRPALEWVIGWACGRHLRCVRRLGRRVLPESPTGRPRQDWLGLGSTFRTVKAGDSHHHLKPCLHNTRTASYVFVVRPADPDCDQSTERR
jgi:hypothetical protein